MKKIWVAGSKGQLGREIENKKASFPSCNFLFTDIEELDLTNQQAVRVFIEKEHPDVIINCAAYTNVDKAESDTENAYKLNVEIPKNLAEALNILGGMLIHISTDYVFDGTSAIPYQETDTTNPQSVYGKSKLLGELEVLKSHQNIVIRTSWLYSIYGNNFVKTMLRLGKANKDFGVVSDQVGSPTYAGDLAAVLITLSISLLEGKKHGGIYHYSNEGQCSWYEFALEIMKIAKLPCHINALSTEEYPTQAKRPMYSLMNKSKIKSFFDIEIPHWKESLHNIVLALNKE